MCVCVCICLCMYVYINCIDVVVFLDIVYRFLHDANINLHDMYMACLNV